MTVGVNIHDWFLSYPTQELCAWELVASLIYIFENVKNENFTQVIRNNTRLLFL